MTIEIPGSLQWVSYLVGSEWPEGDEDAMFRIGAQWHASADTIAALIPSLDRVRHQTSDVLQGVTAGAADEQFALLFDGDASVEKLAEAMAALGALAQSTGKSIEYTKLQVLTSLAIAAFEISWALAQTSVTAGASAAAIPVVEATTSATIRQVVSLLLKQIAADLGGTMRRTMVHRIVKKAGVESAEAVGQELMVQGIQQANGHQKGYDWQKVGVVAIANAAGGGSQGAVSDVGRKLVGDSTVRGAAVGYTAGMAKKIVGALATGQPVDLVAVLGSTPTAATGAVRGRAAARNATRADAGSSMEPE